MSKTLLTITKDYDITTIITDNKLSVYLYKKE